MAGFKVSKNELIMFAALFIALFILMVVGAVLYIGSEALQKVACEQASSDYVWENTTCFYNQTGVNLTSVTVNSVEKIQEIEAAANIAIKLIALVIIVLVFGLIIKVVMGFKGARG